MTFVVRAAMVPIRRELTQRVESCAEECCAGSSPWIKGLKWIEN